MKTFFIIIFVAFVSFDSVAQQENKIKIGILLGLNRPNELAPCKGRCEFNDQEIKIGTNIGISIKKKFRKRFENKLLFNFSSIKKSMSFYGPSIYQRAGVTEILSTKEGPVLHDYQSLAFTYQFSYLPFKKKGFSLFTGISLELLIDNKSKRDYTITRIGGVNSDFEYFVLSDPEVSQEESDLELPKTFNALHFGLGYNFIFSKVEFFPNINFYYIGDQKAMMSKSRFNFNIEVYYQL